MAQAGRMRRKGVQPKTNLTGRTQTMGLPVNRPEIVPVDEKTCRSSWRQRPRGGDGTMEGRDRWELTGTWSSAQKHVVITEVLVTSFCQKIHFDVFFKLRSAFCFSAWCTKTQQTTFFLLLITQKHTYPFKLLDANRFTLKININLGGKVRVRTDVWHPPVEVF